MDSGHQSFTRLLEFPDLGLFKAAAKKIEDHIIDNVHII